MVPDPRQGWGLGEVRSWTVVMEVELAGLGDQGH